MATPSKTPTIKTHWAVRMNWKNRSICFALLGGALGSHLLAIDAQPGMWGLLFLQFFLGPQLQYWYGRVSTDPWRAEVRNMTMDTFGYGIWMAALGGPLWISFSLFVGGSVNLLVFLGWVGWARAIAAMAGGALLALCVLPWVYRPETTILTTALLMGTLAWFLGAFAQDGYRRSIKLSQQRAQVRAQLAEIQALKDLLAEQAMRDPLTGTFNRRMLDQQLPLLIESCASRGRGFALMLLNMDKFKEVNDSLGHAVGDQLLVALARHLMHHSRPQDMVFRLGGDEFLLLFPDTPLEIAYARAQKMAQDFVLRSRKPVPDSMRVTLSCGIACYPAHGTDAASLLQHTDDALYQAKAAGRNLVVVYGATEPKKERVERRAVPV